MNTFIPKTNRLFEERKPVLVKKTGIQSLITEYTTGDCREAIDTS
jgi:hypothetical protein